MDSKMALIKAGSLRALATTLLNHQSKQCQLNSCATLYAISCAGREVCKQLASYKPLNRLRVLVNPGVGRTAQDDQLQLFAALLIVNLLHVKGITTKEDRGLLGSSLQRAFDDATEIQVRETIAVGLKRLKTLGKSRLSMSGLSLGRKSSSKPSSSKPSSIGSSGGMGGGVSQGASGMQGFGSAPPQPKKSSMFSRSKKGNFQGSDDPEWNN